MKNRPEIDGLRALAVLPVLLFHAELGCPGGFVGVDVFFVISGFLITSLILGDLEAGRFSLAGFWERRVRRILPALAVVALASLIAAWFMYLPRDFKEFGQSLVAQTLLVSNVYFWRESGYFDAPSAVKPLLHTWSLAVEEQFYLLFPLLLAAIHRFARRFMIPVIALLAVASFGLGVHETHRHPWAAFYFLPMRAWELLLGSLLAALPARVAPTRWLAEVVGWAGLLAILSAVFLYRRATPFPGVAALLPCLGAASIIWANAPLPTSLGRLLSARPLVFIGLISYSLYLWHWPALVFARYWPLNDIPAPLRLAILVACVAIATLAWRFIETPFRRRAILKTRPQIFAFAAATALTLFALGAAIHLRRGFPSRLPAAAQRYADGANGTADIRQMSVNDALTEKFIELGAGDKSRPIQLLLWGDSHASAVLPVVDALCKERGVRGVAATHSSTVPFVGYVSSGRFGLLEDCVPYNDAVVQFIRRRHVRDVLLVARWASCISPTDAARDADRLHQGLVATLDALKDSGARVWVMRQVPQPGWNVPKALAAAVYFGRDPDKVGVPIEDYQQAARREDPIFADLPPPGVTVLDPAPCFAPAARLCPVADAGEALYSDHHHLTAKGAMRLRPMLAPMFGPISEGDGRDPASPANPRP